MLELLSFRKPLHQNHLIKPIYLLKYASSSPNGTNCLVLCVYPNSESWLQTVELVLRTISLLGVLTDRYLPLLLNSCFDEGWIFSVHSCIFEHFCIFCQNSLHDGFAEVALKRLSHDFNGGSGQLGTQV